MDDENEQSYVPSRTRMHFSQTAKGPVQIDITTEYSTPEDASDNMAKAIPLLRKVISDAGLVEVGVEKKD
jgi:hypothetical protein